MGIHYFEFLSVTHLDWNAGCRGSIVAPFLLPHLLPENEAIVYSIIVAESDWLKELRNDPDFRDMITAVLKSDNDRPVKLPRSNAHYVSADIAIDDGYLKLVERDSFVTVVPKSQRENVVREAPEGIS